MFNDPTGGIPEQHGVNLCRKGRCLRGIPKHFRERSRQIQVQKYITMKTKSRQPGGPGDRSFPDGRARGEAGRCTCVRGSVRGPWISVAAPAGGPGVSRGTAAGRAALRYGHLGSRSVFQPHSSSFTAFWSSSSSKSGSSASSRSSRSSSSPAPSCPPLSKNFLNPSSVRSPL